MALSTTLLNYLPQIITIAMQLIQAFINGLIAMLPTDNSNGNATNSSIGCGNCTNATTINTTSSKLYINNS